MLLISLLTIPLIAILAIMFISDKKSSLRLEKEKFIAIAVSIVNIIISFVIYIVNLFSTNQYQLVEEYHKIGNFDFYLGIDGLSIYFVMLITIITPVALLSNWSSIKENVKPFLIIMLLLETLLLTVFIVLDTLLFYIFFESILPPLFLLIGIFGSKNRVRAGFYLFLYTLLGSLFLLLSILNISSMLGTSDFDMIYKTNILFHAQVFIFCGILIAFAVKTPTIFLNTWLLKAHVESPLGGSIILAAIVLKLSLYGILRLILPLLHKVYIIYTPVVYVVGAITILYASISTLRTIDIKELIAYSSVSHAAVYLVGIFSSVMQGIQGGILLGLAHGFVSSGLFVCTGGVLYDRSSTRLISFYRGFTQIMPLFVILFFILCLGNAGTPLSLNFVGEFMSLYGTFERVPLLGAICCSSIVFSAAYTFYMFNRIAFAGTLSEFFMFNLPDLSKREFNVLLILVVFTVILGVYPAPVLDGLQYSTSLVIYNLSNLTNYCDGPNMEGIYMIKNSVMHIEELTKLHTTVTYCALLTGFVVLLILAYMVYKIGLNISLIYATVCVKLHQPFDIAVITLFYAKWLFTAVSCILVSSAYSFLDLKLDMYDIYLLSDGDTPMGSDNHSEDDQNTEEDVPMDSDEPGDSNGSNNSQGGSDDEDEEDDDADRTELEEILHRAGHNCNESSRMTAQYAKETDLETQQDIAKQKEEYDYFLEETNSLAEAKSDRQDYKGATEIRERQNLQMASLLKNQIETLEDSKAWNDDTQSKFDEAKDILSETQRIMIDLLKSDSDEDDN